MLELNKIYNMDCLEGLRQLPDKSVDLILTDTPYGIELEYDIYKDTEDNWFKLMEKAIPEMQRVAKMVIMPSCQIKRLQWIYKHFPPDWLICWNKGSTGHCSYIGFNDWEPLLVYGKTRTNLSMHDSIRVTPTPFDNGHPCPKPLKWALKLIRMATKEGDVVADPFIGSGTVAVAAKQLNRQYIGFDVSTKYCDIAKRRLQFTHKAKKIMDFEKPVEMPYHQKMADYG